MGKEESWRRTFSKKILWLVSAVSGMKQMQGMWNYFFFIDVVVVLFLFKFVIFFKWQRENPMTMTSVWCCQLTDPWRKPNPRCLIQKGFFFSVLKGVLQFGPNRFETRRWGCTASMWDGRTPPPLLIIPNTSPHPPKNPLCLYACRISSPSCRLALSVVLNPVLSLYC